MQTAGRLRLCWYLKKQETKTKKSYEQFEFTCGWTTHLFKAFHNLMALTEHIENIIFKVKLIYSPSSCFLEYFHLLTKVPLLDNREMFH